MSTPLNVRPALLSTKVHTASHSRRAKAPAAFDHEAVKRRIRNAGMDVLTVAPLPDGTGMKYTLLGGELVLVYFNGNHQVQGKVSGDDRLLLRKALHSR